MRYEIQWLDGSTDEYDTYDQATAAVAARFPDAEIGHDGDLSDGGDRTLCWADEEASIDDDGQTAIAVIRRVESGRSYE